MKVLKGLENKKYLSTYSKIHQIASAADQLIAAFYAEEITQAKNDIYYYYYYKNRNSSARRQKFLFSWMWPTKSSKSNFFAAHAIR